MSFSWTSLPISHDGTMITVEYVIEYRSSNFIKNLLLSTLGIEYIIKHEWNLLLSGVFDDELTFIAYSMYFVGIS